MEPLVAVVPLVHSPEAAPAFTASVVAIAPDAGATVTLPVAGMAAILANCMMPPVMVVPPP